MGTTQKKSCFTIPLTNSTASPVEYVLFADNRQGAGVVLPDWNALRNEMVVLKDTHNNMSTEFRILQTENDSFVGRPNFIFTQLEGLMTNSATAFDNLSNALVLQAQAMEVSLIRQIAREVALVPVLVNEIKLITNNIDQLQEKYTFNKNLSLKREGKDKVFDFFNKYNPKLKNPQVTLFEQDLGGSLRFDGTTGFRFWLLPNTSISLQFCYTLAPPPVCCGRQEKILPPQKNALTTKPTTKEANKPQNTPKPTTPKAPASPTAPKSQQPTKKTTWFFVWVALLLFLLCAFLLWWLMQGRESS